MRETRDGDVLDEDPLMEVFLMDDEDDDVMVTVLTTEALWVQIV